MSTKSKSGRPPFKPTPAQRRKVAIAAAGGMAHEEIAVALGICRNTLTKHFEKELSVGAHQKRMDVLEAMARAALKGNVAAAKAFLANTPGLAAPPVEPPVGKKEQANLDAKTAAAGTEWDDLIGAGANVVPMRQAG